MYKYKKILVTGASGYIGKRLIKILPRYFNGYKIYCIDKVNPAPFGRFVGTGFIPVRTTDNNKCCPYKMDRRDEVKDFFRCDLTDGKQLKKILLQVKPEIIFHLAGSGISINYTWQQFFESNYKTTETLLSALKEISSFKPRIILVGSAAEYGRVHPNEMPIKEETPLNPISPYGCVKALQSVLAKYYANTGMDIIVIRPFNMLGQNMSEHLAIGNFQKQLKEIIEKKRPPKIYVGNINVKRDYLDLTDALRAFCLIAKKGKSGEIYNVCSGKAISIKYILKRLCSAYKGKINIVVDKKLLRNNDVLFSYGSNDKLKLHTGWKPSISIEKTIDSLYPQ